LGPVVFALLNGGGGIHGSESSVRPDRDTHGRSSPKGAGTMACVQWQNGNKVICAE
jgi:hypothetical protein